MTFHFLKTTTDDGLVEWSEYDEGYGGAGFPAVIRRLYSIARQALGGINQRAMAAIENVCA